MLGVRAAVLGAALTLAAPVDAQTLKGAIVDSESGEPVTLAYVGLLAEGREFVVAALADGNGLFELDAPGAGSYFLYVARTGYETLMDGVFELGPDGVFEMRVGLKPAPVELEPLSVQANRDISPLEAVGFYERAALGNGIFLIREEIERRVVSRVSEAFREIPNLVVDESRPLLGPDAMQSPALVITRGARRCNPTLYVDGAVVTTGVLGAARPDDFVGPNDVEAAEVYVGAAQVPAQFAAINDCGVVLLWTRAR